jgi:predicted RNA-binding protein YlqC (UPF0109 family)
MKELLEYVVKQITDKPEEVVIEEKKEEGGFVLLTLRVAPEDMGRVIGKKGKIISAIRQLLRVKAIKTNQRVALKLIDESYQKDLPVPQEQTEEDLPQSQTPTE